MRKITLVLAALAGVAAFSGSASADPYKWCAQYSGRDGSSNCYFVNIAQCRAAISGDNAAFCRPNTFYSGHSARDDRRRFN